MSDDFYVPETFQKQSTTNKQGRDESLDSIHGKLTWMMKDVHHNAYGMYEELLELDVARETARAVLPVSSYTEAYWKCNMKNFLHMTHLRADAHAQWEIQEYANAMYNLVKPKFPIICEAFEDYAQNAVTFSGPEMKFIKDFVIGDFRDNWEDYMIDAFYDDLDGDQEVNLQEVEKKLCSKYGISKRELTELKQKLI